MRICTEDKCRLQVQVCFANVLGVNGSTKRIRKCCLALVARHLNHCKYFILVSCCLILLLSCLLMQRLSAQLIVVCYISKHAKLVYHAQFSHDLCGGGYCSLSSVFKIHFESVCYDKPW